MKRFDTDEQTIVVQGIFVKLKLLVIVISIIVVIYAATVLGLVFGLLARNQKSSSNIATSEDHHHHDMSTSHSHGPSSLSSSSYLTSSPTRPVLTTSNAQNEKVNYRLPTNIKPYYYDLTVATKFNDSSEPNDFDGNIKIYFTCLLKTNKLILHMRDIDLINSTIHIKGLTDQTFELHHLAYKYEQKSNFLTFELNKEFQSNHNYTISMQYKGYVKDDLTGFYRSSYIDNNKKKKYILASQMEATDARKAFPCFDEPALKAKFKLKVSHHKSLIAFSNMPSIATRNITSDGSFIETEFDESVPMSTYLLALVISDFKCKQGVANAGKNGKLDLRVCGRPNAFDELDYALKAAIASVEFFQKYFSIEYPLPKLDHLAIPDFFYGAMENWGLVVYKELYLLSNEKTSMISQQNIVDVIAHETSHMWFGNIVTLNWWNDLWLNEGFATYMEILASNHVNKTFEMMEQFIDRIFNTLETDSLSSSHPISNEIEDPAQIMESFDDITYIKGGAVLRMLNYFIGEETFVKGVSKYLKKHAYNNARQEDLWLALHEQLNSEGKRNINIGNIMRSWIKQSGHPVVNIKKTSSNSISISQKQFLKNPSSSKSSTNKWYIPFTYSIEKVGVNSNTTKLNMSTLYPQIIWISPNDENKTIQFGDSLGKENFILANLDFSGLYRVNYDIDNWNLIIQQLKTNFHAISDRNRALLINDIFSLANAEQLSIKKPLELINYLVNETEYLPFETAQRQLWHILTLLDESEIYGSFSSYILKLINPLYRELGWNTSLSDTWLDRLLRNRLLAFACSVGMQECIDTARNMFNSWIQSNDRNAINPSYRGFVYCTAIKHGSTKDWEFLSIQFDKETDASHRRALHRGLSCTKEPWLLRRYLNDQFNETKVKRQEAFDGLRNIASSSYGNLIAWNFVKSNWSLITERLPYQLSEIIASITDRFNTQYLLDDFIEFFNKYPNRGSATMQINVSIESIKSNINWMNKPFNEIKLWLSENL